jgi:hypothetical protein
MSALESMFGAMTLAELAQFANTTIGNIVEAAYAGRPSSSSKAKTSKSAKSTAPKATKAKVATSGKVERGGLKPDQVLAALAAVRPGPAKLEDVRARTGGTVPQVRAALQRLAGAKKVKITGQRRGTRYAVA